LNQSLMMLRSRMAQQSTRGPLFNSFPKRGFSTSPQANNLGAYMMGAVGLGGLAYVTLKGSEMSSNRGEY